METSVKLLILLGAIAGSGHAAGVLPDSIFGTAGGTVTFTTSVIPPSTPFLVVTWSFVDVHGASANIITSSTVNLTAPEYTDRITLLRDTGSLELWNLTVSDAGEYRVTIIPTTGAQQRGHCRLVVHAPVSNVAVAASSTDLVEFNSSVRLSCSSSGSSLSFLWLNGTSAVTASDRAQIADGGATLTIVTVTRYDPGPFRCHVYNPFSDGTSDPLKLSISYGPENVHLTTSPPQEYHKKGSNINLSCSVVSRPSAVMTWFLNGDMLPETGAKLRLDNVQENQSGNYSCQAFNGKTLKYQTSQPWSLTVLAPVSDIQVSASTTDVLEFSSSVRLSCSSSGSSPSFLWRNRSSEVTASDRVQITDGGATLTIVTVTRHDPGPFRCRVSNPVSKGSSDPVHISISYGPENMNLTKSPSLEYYDEGSDISLVCSVDSSPSALFQWFHDDVLMSATGPELKLLNVHMHQRGNYTCQAFNNKTLKYQTSQPADISVRTSHVSNVVVTPSATDVSELAGSVRLSCSSSGSFRSFVWLNSSAEMTAGDRVHITDKGAVLTIVHVTRYDEGPFRCHVFNDFSNYTSEPVTLSISFGPENIQLTTSPSQQHYEIGSDVRLSCSAVSRPSALFQWFLSGDPLPETGAEVRLIDMQRNQSGSYVCRAFNNKTLRYQTSRPAVISILAPVSNVTVSSNTSELLEFNSSVRLSCSSSGSSPSFRWLNRSSEVTASDRVQITDGGATLTLVTVTRYDPGPFRCNVSNSISAEVSQPVTLVVQYGPDNMAVVGPDAVREGDFTMLYCSAMSVPSASFSWLLNGNPTDVHVSAYVIPTSRRADSGRYSCTAVNAVTGRSQTAHHQLSVSDSSDCSAATGWAILITAGCCVIIATVSLLIAYGVMRRKRVNNNYVPKEKEKIGAKVNRSGIYKITEKAPSKLSTAF